MERKYFCTSEVTRFFNKRSIWESTFNAPSLTPADAAGGPLAKNWHLPWKFAARTATQFHENAPYATV
jgi:hypothetical protein